MATGNEILSYRGDAGLGLGGNADIPAPAVKDLQGLQQVGRDIFLTDVARNQQLFQQKIKDRDTLLQAIDSGDLKVGDLLEQDTPYVKEGLNALDKAWADRVKRGVNDIDATLAYKKALREAQDRVTQAQARKVFRDQEQGALSKETLGRRQKARKENLDKVIGGGFWQDLTPYQQTHDLNFDPINAYPKVVTTEFTDPKNPLMKGKKSVIDFAQVQGAAQKDFLENNDIREDQIGLFESIQSMPEEKLVPALGTMAKRLDEYNRQRGFLKGDPNYLELNVAEGPNGELIINETVPDFAAKWALANQPMYATSTSSLDKDAANYQLGQERNRIAAANAGANQLRARTYAALQQKKLSQMNENEKRVMGIWPKIISQVKTAKNGVDVVWSGDIPKGYANINGLNAKGEPIRLTPFKNKGGAEFFKVKYKDGDGNDINLLELYNSSEAKKNGYSFEEVRKTLLKNGGVNMEIQGENGTGDFNSAMETARSLSNKLSSGKEEPIFQEPNPDEE